MSKKKGTKLAFSDFLNDSSTGSWADEMDSLPTAPSGRVAGEPGFGQGRFTAGGYGDRAGGIDRAPRADVPLPTKPPYTAFVGNLSFEVTDSDLRALFAEEQVTTVRLITGVDGKLKGYGYVEFAELDGLKAALAKSGSDFNGRAVRVTVAEAKDTAPDRSDGDWSTRAGPLPPVAGRTGFSSGGFGSRDRMGAGSIEEDREWGAVRGAKFTPSSSGPPSRSASGYGTSRLPSRDASFTGSAAIPDEDRGERMGIGSQFRPSTAAPQRSPVLGGSGFSDAGSRRASAFSPTLGGTTDADNVNQWRRAAPTPVEPLQNGVTEGDGSRRKLALAKRTVSTDAESFPPTPTTAGSSKPSPFGAAAPIDTLERQRAIDEKIQREAEDRETKLKADREARDKAIGDRKSAPNPFGEAKPVDVAPAKERPPVQSRALSATGSNDSAQRSDKAEAGGAWRSSAPKTNRPNGSNSSSRDRENTQQQRKVLVKDKAAIRDALPKDASPPLSPPVPKAFAASSALRKEGFSYAKASQLAAAEREAASAAGNTVAESAKMDGLASASDRLSITDAE
ncbi:uncharacterized protein L969DRAFT_105330 [Mixia osmundae IAM 14324]|uniref:RRM domain-containing protein n=1 Tax=Mixia osmundae (strain CBS 9802 / IAM 14324 / JCM 22182 / KY 12970) TaxID=764103 RepID=G7EB11_MIXOS|nr:uncharacterized protein L969DRAFT_105330 [Mixia osmundae IAM 14324]KEI37056.1 hypothetical protein L969DRAFT_105330 [Mixia osmundae IAM 14324]GAB00022.1 hypothetical protein E5Q_06724 [Mixia osmundae IAM 14324]